MRIAVKDNRASSLDPRTVQCQHRRLQVALQHQSLPSHGGWECCPLVSTVAPSPSSNSATRLMKAIAGAFLAIFHRF